ncbi:MAG: hypothetical protein JNL82_39670 [Myxococcales bacterium]|nr:hypothetical protein [Myxococcales bacterium]
MNTRAAWIFSGVVALAGACDEADERVGFDEGEVYELRAAVDNSSQLNGQFLNGQFLNGQFLNGQFLNSGVLSGDDGATDMIHATELVFDGAAAQAVWLEGSQLFVRDAGGVVVAGAAVNKLKLKYDLRDLGVAKKKVIKISHAQPIKPGSDVWVHDIEVKEGNGVWKSLCVDGGGQPTQAILLNDVWNPATGDRAKHTADSLTYACRGTALAKCVEWGYKPWASVGGTSLYNYHQACSRMVRADYCGDGVAHTVNGTPIHVTDKKGVQAVDPNIDYVVEAEWSARGATCLNRANTRLPGQDIECSLPACGTSFSSGGIIQSGKIVAP